MRRSRKRLLALLASLVAVLVVSALLYMVGMNQLEGRPRGFWQALEWAAETLSTTGYGADASWSHPLMVCLVVLVQFLGVFLVFLIFPIYLIPFLEERFETRLPGDCADARNHVLIYRNGPAVASLIEELKLIPSDGGRFEVTVNGKLLYSKLETHRHAEPGEVLGLVRKMAGE